MNGSENQHRIGQWLVKWNNKPLHGPMSTDIYVTRKRHKAAMYAVYNVFNSEYFTLLLNEVKLFMLLHGYFNRL